VAATRASVRHILGRNLVGLYVHGSLATVRPEGGTARNAPGGFCPRRSDVDLLALTRRRLTNFAKKKMVEAMLRLSGNPRPIE